MLRLRGVDQERRRTKVISKMVMIRLDIASEPSYRTETTGIKATALDPNTTLQILVEERARVRDGTPRTAVQKTHQLTSMTVTMMQDSSINLMSTMEASTSQVTR